MVKRGIAEVCEVAQRRGPILLRRAARRGVLACKSSYLAAVAASGHRTPAAAARARIVVEEQTTMRISADSKACAGSLGDNLCPRPGHGGEQPVKTAFPGDEV